MIQTIQSCLMLFLCGLYTALLILLMIPRRGREKSSTVYPPLSILIPAYNEAKNIRETLESLQAASYPAPREIILVDDGSQDRTVEVAKTVTGISLQIIQTERLGKARALNVALQKATHEIIIVLDADTTLAPTALLEIVVPFENQKVAAVAANVRAVVTKKILTWFQELEYALFSAWRVAQNKINAVCVVPQFCALRKSALEKIGGIPADTATEDFDVCFELTRAGYQVVMEEKALAFTKVPETISGLFRQRVRWARGILQVVSKHRVLFFSRRFFPLGAIAMPTLVYWYFHAALYLPTTLYQIGHDYWFYFIHKDQWFSAEVLQFIFGWMTLYGVSRLAFQVGVGFLTMTPSVLLIFVVCSLSYGLTFVALYRFGGKRSFSQAVAIFCFFPYCLFALAALCYGLFSEIRSRLKGFVVGTQ
ncbi:MAG: glycosyltransferase, partial [Deltaproteobacteria bacterium]|nr:glycosyltransferase [Deltaproteobacteria bacterium]